MINYRANNNESPSNENMLNKLTKKKNVLDFCQPRIYLFIVIQPITNSKIADFIVKPVDKVFLLFCFGVVRYLSQVYLNSTTTTVDKARVQIQYSLFPFAFLTILSYHKSLMQR